MRPPNDALGGDASKVGPVPPSPGNVRASVLRIVRQDVAEPRVGQIRVTQVGIPQIAASEADTSERGAPEVDATEVTQLERVPIKGTMPKIATCERFPRRARQDAHPRTVARPPVAEPPAFYAFTCDPSADGGHRLSAGCGRTFCTSIKAARDGPHAPPPGRASVAPLALRLRPRNTPGGWRGEREAQGAAADGIAEESGEIRRRQPAAPRLSSAAQVTRRRARAASPEHGSGVRRGHAGRPGAGSAAAHGQVNCSPGRGRVAADGQLRPREAGPYRSRSGQLRHCGGVRRGHGP